MTVRVVTDGSGDYASLQLAVKSVSPGSTILLEAGAYRLEEQLEIRGHRISITDDKAFSMRRSPFRTIGSIIELVEVLV